MNFSDDPRFKISISHTQRGDHFLLQVEFSTSSHEPIDLEYRSPASRFVDGNLRFFDEDEDQPIEPINWGMVSSHARTEVVLTADEPHVFLIEGLYDPPLLKFPTAVFELLPGVPYRLRFGWQRVRSNVVILDMPTVVEPLAPTKLRALMRLLWGPVASEAEIPQFMDYWLEMLKGEE